MEHFQHRREDLQEEYNLLVEKMGQLRKAYAVETNAANQFQLKRQIKQTETEMAELEKILDKLERIGNIQNLYQALLQLGYWQQVFTFRKFVESRPVAAFLIYGSTHEYGQQWLMNRLVRRYMSNYSSSRIIRVDLNRISQKCDVATLWRELARDLLLSRSSESSAIIERVYQCWQTQHTLLVFDGVNSFPKSYLQEFIQKFWHPLVEKAPGLLMQSNPFRLYMFMLDYEGAVDEWDIPFVKDFEPNWKPEIPVKLPLIQEFSDQDLFEWLRQRGDDLPLYLLEAMDQTVETILKNSDNGIPEPSLAEICRLANIDWSELKDKAGLR